MMIGHNLSYFSCLVVRLL